MATVSLLALRWQGGDWNKLEAAWASLIVPECVLQYKPFSKTIAVTFMVTKFGCLQWRTYANKDEGTPRIVFRFYEDVDAVTFQVVEDFMEWKVQSVKAATPCSVNDFLDHVRTQGLCLVRDGPAVSLLQAATLRGFRKMTVPYVAKLYELRNVTRGGRKPRSEVALLDALIRRSPSRIGRRRGGRHHHRADETRKTSSSRASYSHRKFIRGS